MPNETPKNFRRNRQDDLREELLAAMIEYRGSDLMEATIAACAIIAHADGNVAMVERVRMIHMMHTDPLLAMFPRETVLQEFEIHTRAYEADYGKALQEATRLIMKIAGREKYSKIVLNACLLITAADGRVDPRELDAISLVRDALTPEPHPGSVPAQPDMQLPTP